MSIKKEEQKKIVSICKVSNLITNNSMTQKSSRPGDFPVQNSPWVDTW